MRHNIGFLANCSWLATVNDKQSNIWLLLCFVQTHLNIICFSRLHYFLKHCLRKGSAMFSACCFAAGRLLQVLALLLTTLRPYVPHFHLTTASNWVIHRQCLLYTLCIIFYIFHFRFVLGCFLFLRHLTQAILSSSCIGKHLLFPRHIFSVLLWSLCSLCSHDVYPSHTKLVLTMFFRMGSNCVQTSWT